MRHLVLVSGDHHGRRLLAHLSRRSATGQVHSVSGRVLRLVDGPSAPVGQRQRHANHDDDDDDDEDAARQRSGQRSATGTTEDEA